MERGSTGLAFYFCNEYVSKTYFMKKLKELNRYG